MPSVTSGQSVALIVNPTAGTSRSRLGPAGAVRLFERRGFATEILVTRHPGEATELAAVAAQRHPVVAAVGGDGTVREVGMGLLASNAALAVLPTGSGNDYAKALGIASPAAGVEAACGAARRVDVAYLDDQPFFNSAGFFLSGLVSQRAARLWRQAGRWRYVLAALSAAPFYRPRSAAWRFAEEPRVRQGRYLLMEVGNGPSAGGGFMLLPDADPSDGLLDLCLVGPLSLWSLSRLFPAAASGKRVNHPLVERPRTARASLELERSTPIHLDGEVTILPAGLHDLRVEQGALAVHVPVAEARKESQAGSSRREMNR